MIELYHTLLELFWELLPSNNLLPRSNGIGSKNIQIVFVTDRPCVYTGQKYPHTFGSAIRTLLDPLTKLGHFGSEYFSAPCRRVDRIRGGADISDIMRPNFFAIEEYTTISRKKQYYYSFLGMTLLFLKCSFNWQN